MYFLQILFTHHAQSPGDIPTQIRLPMARSVLNKYNAVVSLPWTPVNDAQRRRVKHSQIIHVRVSCNKVQMRCLNIPGSPTQLSEYCYIAIKEVGKASFHYIERDIANASYIYFLGAFLTHMSSFFLDREYFFGIGGILCTALLTFACLRCFN